MKPPGYMLRKAPVKPPSFATLRKKIFKFIHCSLYSLVESIKCLDIVMGDLTENRNDFNTQ